MKKALQKAGLAPIASAMGHRMVDGPPSFAAAPATCIPRRLAPHVLHVDYLPEKGRGLFALACEQDLEGVVGKWAQGTYQASGRTTSSVKVKNPSYTQTEGRAEFFEGKSRRTRRSRGSESRLP